MKQGAVQIGSLFFVLNIQLQLKQRIPEIRKTSKSE